MIAAFGQNNCVRIEEQLIDPTNEQAQACLRVCQMLSNYYRDIQVFRFDDQTRYVFILAGEELQILVPTNGRWSFINETQF